MVGFEMLGTPQRDITPEIAAERLRELAGKKNCHRSGAKNRLLRNWEGRTVPAQSCYFTVSVKLGSEGRGRGRDINGSCLRS